MSWIFKDARCQRGCISRKIEDLKHAMQMRRLHVTNNHACPSRCEAQACGSNRNAAKIQCSVCTNSANPISLVECCQRQCPYQPAENAHTPTQRRSIDLSMFPTFPSLPCCLDATQRFGLSALGWSSKGRRVGSW